MVLDSPILELSSSVLSDSPSHESSTVFGEDSTLFSTKVELLIRVLFSDHLELNF